MACRACYFFVSTNLFDVTTSNPADGFLLINYWCPIPTRKSLVPLSYGYRSQRGQHHRHAN